MEGMITEGIPAGEVAFEVKCMYPYFIRTYHGVTLRTDPAAETNFRPDTLLS